ncbi:hypothetical protein BDB00DRAFT_786322 [Zychaea mexicana]|uniref:uncharacterized protein n=1 Tax=Zychaea mexicana TaxID=64656 RepID=UPI0022FED4DA|nr:uncharacterized protein BDB00DRAFT_786322 [Zychaea mexicana]KAI9495520.1 hypothetical protein BDB00DRAFT_786322 [Zychaea mexicana]
MAVPELPTEVIILIIDYLPRAHIVRLLTVNRHWRDVITARLYRTICIRSIQEQYEYRNLFNETRRRRLRQQQSQSQHHQQDQQEEEEEDQSPGQQQADKQPSAAEDGSNNKNTSGFYSSENYGLYVRELDLSIPYSGKDITDSLLYDLALDCPNLEVLNLYNCHRVTTVAVKRSMHGVSTNNYRSNLQQQQQQQQPHPYYHYEDDDYDEDNDNTN